MVGALWKKKKLYMVLNYKDDNGNIQNIVLDVDKIEEVQPTIYRRMMQAKKIP